MVGKLLVLIVVCVAVVDGARIKTIIPTVVIGKNKITLTKGVE